MKDVILIFAVAMMTLMTIELMPSMITPQVKISKLAESAPIVPLSRHNLNRGQLRKMDWLKHLGRM